MNEVIEDEWLKFKFTDSQELDQALFSPLIVLPVLDDKVGRKIPSNLLYPTKDLDVARLHIRMLFILRHLLFYLFKNDENVAQKAKQRLVSSE